MHIAIIGNGISGVTTARHIRKYDRKCKITLISGEREHFFSRTALMYIYMGHMRYRDTKPYEDFFWSKNRIDLKMGFVTEVSTDSKELVFTSGEKLSYDKLVLATGSKSNKFGWPGQGLKGVQGLYSFQDLESMEENTKTAKHAVIVGGGLIGVEMAEMLLTRNIKVTFLVREARFWGNVLPEEEGNIVMNHIREHHVDLKLNTELAEIVSNEYGRAKAVITKSGETIDCQFVGLTAGVSPNIQFVKESNIKTNRGIIVNKFLETNIPDVYAAGDCAEFENPPGKGRRNIEQVWYTGKMMGQTLANTITGNRIAYQPGVWFNSAKFFDLEYQTYGWVWPKAKENEEVFYWEHISGKKCLKLVFDKTDKNLLGINVFGIRMRHKTCDAWIKNKKDINYVIEHLKDANFDPEFYTQHEEEIVAKFNQEYGTSIKPKRKNWTRIFS